MSPVRAGASHQAAEKPVAKGLFMLPLHLPTWRTAWSDSRSRPPHSAVRDSGLLPTEVSSPQLCYGVLTGCCHHNFQVYWWYVILNVYHSEDGTMILVIVEAPTLEEIFLSYRPCGVVRMV